MTTPLSSDERIDRVNEDITLIQKKDGLTFGTDAFLLAAYVRSLPHARAAELGSGTGIVSFLLATKGKAAHITALELQPDFVELTRRNITENHLANRVSVLEQDIRSVRADTLGYECDLVFSNPPYMTTRTGAGNSSPRKNTARHETAGGISDFALAASRLLKHGGYFTVVYRTERLPDLLLALRSARLEPKRLTLVHSDRHSPPAMLLCEAKKGAAPGLSVTKPLFLYEDPDPAHPDAPRILTREAASVYDTCAFPRQ